MALGSKRVHDGMRLKEEVRAAQESCSYAAQQSTIFALTQDFLPSLCGRLKAELFSKQENGRSQE